MQYIIAIIFNFNPRSHERSDTIAPATRLIISYFNPRSHERSDQPIGNHTATIIDFNPRSHERSDKAIRLRACGCFNFNPRSHERSDRYNLKCLMFERFQSTLPREERQPLYFYLFNIKQISIHAPTRGATTTERIESLYITISIHAPTRGATSLRISNHSLSVFQSTLPREERQQYCTKNLFIFIQYRQ